MLREEMLRDVGALGGFPIFFLITLFALSLDRFLFWELLIGFILTFGVTVLIRAIYYTDRPVKEKYDNFIRKIHSASFPSLHTMRASLLATLLGMQLSYYLLIPFLLAAAGVGYSRVSSKRHFVKDVVVGYVLGVLLAVVSIYAAGYVVFN